MYKLFKKDNAVNLKLFNYIKKLKNNNLDKIVKNIDQIEVVNMEAASHLTILEHEEIIAAKIMEE